VVKKEPSWKEKGKMELKDLSHVLYLPFVIDSGVLISIWRRQARVHVRAADRF